MQYFKISTGKYIEYDEKTDMVRVIVKSKLEAQIQEATTKLNSVSALPSDKELLVWAKVSHPQRLINDIERNELESVITTNQNILKELK